jgi:hypothetical protein
MNATQFRAWLEGCRGRQIDLRPGFANRQGAPSGDANGSCELYIPINVTGVHRRRFGRAFGSPYRVEITNSDNVHKDGVYLPDAENECTRVNATTSSGGIVISGRFTGCTFAKCVQGGNTWVGHVYVNAAAAGNDPAAQARAFENGCGAAANTARGYQTAGRVALVAGGLYGLVIGTFVGAAWQWKWVVLDARAPARVLHVSTIKDVDAVDL